MSILFSCKKLQFLKKDATYLKDCLTLLKKGYSIGRALIFAEDGLRMSDEYQIYEPVYKSMKELYQNSSQLKQLLEEAKEKGINREIILHNRNRPIYLFRALTDDEILRHEHALKKRNTNFDEIFSKVPLDILKEAIREREEGEKKAKKKDQSED